MKKEYHFLSDLERYFMNYLKAYFKNLFEKESGQFNLWLPIVFACGIACYFYLPFEPNPLFLILSFVLSVIGFILVRTKSNIALIFLLFLFFFAGFSRISFRTQNLNTTFISKPYNFVNITGKIDKIDLKENGYRLTLNNLKTSKIPSKERPIKIQLSVKGTESIPNIGDIINLKAHLKPPSLAWYPNGYNFARHAYYQNVGAVGFAVSDLKIIQQNTNVFPMEQIRNKILKRISEVLPNDMGDIITALIIGEQGKISKEIRLNYNAAGIIHILSVSGFHMTLIAGFIFSLLRFMLCLVPYVSLRYNTKKICALLALFLTFLYLLISGMATPAIRSFLMIGFVLLTVLFDRQALSIRSLSWAGFLILLFYPEDLMTASFILSFFACYVLISSYESLYPKFKNFLSDKSFLFKTTIGSFLFFLIINILIFIALSPIVIYHFNRFNSYSLIGNFFTSALFSLLIMPLLFIASLLMLFGIDKPFLLSAGYLIEKINLLCEWIANFPYAQIILPPLSDIGYTLFLFGVLWICCWKTNIRFWGLILIFYGLFSIILHQTPDVIIAQNGKIIALKQNKTLVVNSTNSNIINYWFERNGFDVNITPKTIKTNKPIYHKGLWFDFTGSANGNFDIIVNNEGPCHAKIVCIPSEKLKKEGTHTIYIHNKSIDIKTSAERKHYRPWQKGKYNVRYMVHSSN